MSLLEMQPGLGGVHSWNVVNVRAVMGWHQHSLGAGQVSDGKKIKI